MVGTKSILAAALAVTTLVPGAISAVLPRWCQYGEVDLNGVCGQLPPPSCPIAGQISCDDYLTCFDPSNDPLNCGECGNYCPEESTCMGGHCVCVAHQGDDVGPGPASRGGQRCCGGFVPCYTDPLGCIDANTDPRPPGCE